MFISVQSKKELIFIRLEKLQTHQLNCSKNSLFVSCFFCEKKIFFIFVFYLQSNFMKNGEEKDMKKNKERKFSLVFALQTPKKKNKEN